MLHPAVCPSTQGGKLVLHVPATQLPEALGTKGPGDASPATDVRWPHKQTSSALHSASVLQPADAAQ
jgi:hypothetical protein